MAATESKNFLNSVRLNRTELKMISYVTLEREIKTDHTFKTDATNSPPFRFDSESTLKKSLNWKIKINSLDI